MIEHILVPLDGSAVAECVLPHALSIALSTDSHITLLHVLEFPRANVDSQPVDPLDWHLRKHEAEQYLEKIAAKLRTRGLRVTPLITEGSPAEHIIDFANSNEVNLIVLSSHGRSGLSGWNVSSVVQKIILRAFKSIMLIRAYVNSGLDFEEAHYKRLFVGLDFSTRAEYILPHAISLAQYHHAELVLGTVIRKPELLHRFPLSQEDQALVDRIAERNYRTVSHYFDQLRSRLSLQGIDLQTRLAASDNVMATLHNMVEQENADLVLLVAHGNSGDIRWPYGSIATSFIDYGTTSLMIMQDLSADEIKRTQAELAARETKGH
jgi:nucleotide-binding universal stress UspA family protein